MAYETLKLERDGNVLTIVLSRPGGRYGLTTHSLNELGDVLEMSEIDPAIRAIVITSDSKAFCVGAEMSSLETGFPSLQEMTQTAERIHERIPLRIAHLPKPVIAAVNGVAAGGGMAIALACDIRIAADSARFVTAYGNIAITPDMGTTYFLPHLVGTSKALELYLLNDPVSAQQALSLGLVSRVVPDAELMTATRELAQRLASGPTYAFGQTKLLINSALRSDSCRSLPHLLRLCDVDDRLRCPPLLHYLPRQADAQPYAYADHRPR